MGVPAPARAAVHGAAWVGGCIAAFALAILIVFVLQNTGQVDVTFLWKEGGVPLALALLLAAVGAWFVVAVVGAVRITQVRHRLPRRPS